MSEYGTNGEILSGEGHLAVDVICVGFLYVYLVLETIIYPRSAIGARAVVVRPLGRGRDILRVSAGLNEKYVKNLFFL